MKVGSLWMKDGWKRVASRGFVDEDRVVDASKSFDDV